jgi:hypothetical protein
MEFIGHTFLKKFQGRFFQGEVTTYNPTTDLWKVTYVDDDQEEFDRKDMQEYFKDFHSTNTFNEQHVSKTKVHTYNLTIFLTLYPLQHTYLHTPLTVSP